MAVPTFSSATPAVGPAFGRNIIEILGTDFRLPPTPPPGPTDGVAPNTVSVTFEGEEALRVDVISTTLLRVFVPMFRGDSNDDTLDPVDLVITNLDDSGVPIGGETVTATNAYTYERTGLRAPGIEKSPFEQISRELLRYFKRAVTKNVSLTVHTDFGDAVTTELNTTELPSVHLVGPRASFDPEFVSEEFDDRDIGGGEVERFDPPEAFILEYDVIGTSDSQFEILSLMTAAREVIERSAYLEVDPDPPATVRLQFPLRWVSEPSEISTPSNANLRVFTSTLQVQAVWVYMDEPRDRLTEITVLDGDLSDLVGTGPEGFLD